MAVGEGSAGFASHASEGIFGDIPQSTACVDELCKPAALTAAGASSQSPKLVYVKYKDHVFFRNVQTLPTESVIRESVGWVKKENDEIMLIECDRLVLQGYSGCNGVVILKNCIVSMVELPLQSFLGGYLNCQEVTKTSEYSASAKEVKNSTRSSRGGKSKRKN